MMPRFTQKSRGKAHEQREAVCGRPRIAYSSFRNAFRGWRSLGGAIQTGPVRGGRVIAVVGVPSEPNTYYFGGVAGGVWKTTDGGINWTPLFDRQPVSSIGSIAVADSDPRIIHVMLPLAEEKKGGMYGRERTLPVAYSYRSASTGFRREARSAGTIPLSRPTRTRMPVESATVPSVMLRWMSSFPGVCWR